MDPLMMAAIGLILLAAVGLGGGLYVIINPSRSARDRLDDLTGGGAAAGAPQQESAGLVKVRGAMASVAAPKSEEELDALRQNLIQAGYRSKNNVELYSALRFGLAILLPLALLALQPQWRFWMLVLAALSLAALGYYLPAIIVTNAKQKRQEAIMRAFPDALDMLVASVEAGLGLDAAFRRIASETEEAGPLLAEELQLVNMEVSAGIPRVEALKHLETRTGLEELGSLVNVLIQAERFGTPVARSLRIHSEMVRTKRMQAAEENAAKISPKLTVAMIFFMLPCLIIILIGPAVIKVVRNLLPALSG
jgi:tight adherence protein C